MILRDVEIVVVVLVSVIRVTVRTIIPELIVLVIRLVRVRIVEGEHGIYATDRVFAFSRWVFPL
jgi:hypothetical protein